MTLRPDWPESPANGPLEIAVVRIKPDAIRNNRTDLWIFVGQPDETTCCDECEDGEGSPCICKSVAVPLSSIDTLINALRVAQHVAKGGGK